MRAVVRQTLGRLAGDVERAEHMMPTISAMSCLEVRQQAAGADTGIVTMISSRPGQIDTANIAFDLANDRNVGW